MAWNKFVFRLAEAEHQAALGDDVRGDFLGPRQHVERGAVLRARTHQRREAFDGFEVVVENLRSGVEHGLQAIALRVEIGHEDLDDHASGPRRARPEWSGQNAARRRLSGHRARRR